MITALRAALLCDSTTKDANDSISLHGLHTDRFTYAQRPAYLRASLFIYVDLDGKAAPASLRLKAPHFNHRVPLVQPLGMASTALVVDFTLPIVEPGQLVATLMDEGPRGKSFVTKWLLGFTDNPTSVAVSAEDVIRICNEETATKLAHLTGRAPDRH